MKSRIQKFEPSSGKTTQNKMVKNMSIHRRRIY